MKASKLKISRMINRFSLIEEILEFTLFSIISRRGAGMTQWWEHSPPTKVVQGRFLELGGHVG